MNQINGQPVACNRDCGATCAMVARPASSGTIRLTANPLNHDLKRPCLRGLRSPESRNAADRLTTPLLRTGDRGSGRFQKVTWDTALDAIAERLSNVVDRGGAEAIMNFGGSGACKGALHNTGRLASRFLNLVGAVTQLEGSYSFQAASVALPYAYGSASAGYDARTLLDTRFVLLWGANICDTRFGNETEQVIRHVKRNGGEVIVIDPRNSRTAQQLSTEWVPILPGTDTAAMLAMAWVLFNERLTDRSFIASHVHGAEDLESYVSGNADGVRKSPEWAAPVCGIPAETIRNLARRYAAARPAALVPGYSIQRALGGEDAVRMAVALQALTGNTGRPGGTPGTNMWFGLPGPEIPVLGATSPTGRTVEKAIWPESILGNSVVSDPPHSEGRFVADPEPNAIMAAYVVGTNYLNQGSNVARNIQAFESLDFIVCHELFLTPTARYADIVLPATHFLEREDVIVPEDNYLYFSAKIFDPVGEARDDFDILADLSRRLGFGKAFDEGMTKEQWLDRIIDGSAVTEGGKAGFKATGIYDGGDHERYGLDPFIADPEGNPLDTPSGRIELSSKAYEHTGFPAWPAYRAAARDPGHPLMLVTPHSRLRVNSTGSNIPWVRKDDPVRVWLNPADAEVRRIADGDLVTVANAIGQMLLIADVTEDVMPGVVCCVEGGWFGADGSANQLTPLEPTMPSAGTRTHSAFVEVRAGHDSGV